MMHATCRNRALVGALILTTAVAAHKARAQTPPLDKLLYEKAKVEQTINSLRERQLSTLMGEKTTTERAIDSLEAREKQLKKEQKNTDRLIGVLPQADSLYSAKGAELKATTVRLESAKTASDDLSKEIDEVKKQIEDAKPKKTSLGPWTMFCLGWIARMVLGRLLSRDPKPEKNEQKD